MTIDWGDGDYARTAMTLQPAAERLVAAAGIGRGERVLDVACGTGNVSLAAVAAGGRALGGEARHLSPPPAGPPPGSRSLASCRHRSTPVSAVGGAAPMAARLIAAKVARGGGDGQRGHRS